MSDGEDFTFTSESEVSRNVTEDSHYDFFSENWFVEASTSANASDIVPEDIFNDTNDFVYSDDEVAEMAASNTKSDAITNEQHPGNSCRRSNFSNNSSRESSGDISVRRNSREGGFTSIHTIPTLQFENNLSTDGLLDVSSDQNESNNSDVKIIVSNGDENSSVINSIDIITENSSTPLRLSVPNSKRFRRRSDEGDVEIIEPDLDVIEVISSDSECNFSTSKRRKLSTVSIGSSIDESDYQRELAELNDIESELSTAEDVLRNLPYGLPDGGKRLEENVEKLTTKLGQKVTQMANLKVRTRIISAINDGRSRTSTKKLRSRSNRISIDSRSDTDDIIAIDNNDENEWHNLSQGLQNQINDGKLNSKAFNAEKEMTVERLKNFHSSLKQCPSENSLASDPEGLKVTLMKHQKYALNWLKWREQESLPGGVLADDMGLGKTLTMISMILANKLTTPVNEENDWLNGNGRKILINGGTLVVCPASLIRQWEMEIKTKTISGRLSALVHHGTGRDNRPTFLSRHDVVITTYAILSDNHKDNGPLFGIKWQRIILDEAHVIRNHKSQTSIAVCALKGKYRWALTGTPVQNRADDVYAILKFLECTPFNDIKVWKSWITSRENEGPKRLNVIMKTLMLRRTKAELIASGELKGLPNKRIELINIELNQDEMNVYQKILAYSRKMFADYLSQRSENYGQLGIQTHKQAKAFDVACQKAFQAVNQTEQNNIKTYEILVLLLRLRQVCVHPGLIESMLEDESFDAGYSRPQSDINLLAEVEKITNSRGNQKIVERASAQILRRDNPVFDLKKLSTKMKMIIDTVRRCISSTNDKAIIVSQWTCVLGILRTQLKSLGITTLGLDGTVPVKDRHEIVSNFNDAANPCKILLLSLTAGGVGLNLVGANHLLLVDLHWNPQLEEQAQDRIYRVGQKKDVIIYKFICKNTVEETIKIMQDHKLQVADGVLSGGDGTRLSLQNLKQLFGL